VKWRCYCQLACCLDQRFILPKILAFSTFFEPLTLPNFKCYLRLWGMIQMYVPMQGHLIQGRQCTQCFLVMWTACLCPMNGGRDLRESMQVVVGIYNSSHWQKWTLTKDVPHLANTADGILIHETWRMSRHYQMVCYMQWLHWHICIVSHTTTDCDVIGIFNSSLTSLNS
jgi:hypothetical protein